MSERVKMLLVTGGVVVAAWAVNGITGLLSLVLGAIGGLMWYQWYIGDEGSA